MAHPVPQNVTAFEFHLIGNMTIRQFCYLAAGLAIAYLIFLMFASIVPFIAYPLILISAGLGAAFAFLPIMERPLDYWMAAFAKAITKPTVRKYQSKKVMPLDDQFKNRLELYIDFLHNPQKYLPEKEQKLTPTPLQVVNTPVVPAEEPKAQVHPPLPVATPAAEPKVSEPTSIPAQPATPEPQIFAQVMNTISFTPPPQPAQPVVAKDAPSKEELDQTIELAKQAQTVKSQIIETEKQLEQIKSQAAQPGVNPNEFTTDFQTILTNLHGLNEKARKITREIADKQKPVQAPAVPPQVPPRPNIIPTLTLTQIPNIVNGIVTDNQGNYLDGAIVVAHDKQGLPVRALKSNKLGQFVAATPLDDGTYTLNIEKDNMIFDVIQIELKGQVLNPVVISAKPQVATGAVAQ